MQKNRKNKKIRDSTIFEVKSLFEFSRVVNSDMGLDFILNHFLLTVMGKLLCTRGVIFLKEKSGTFKVNLVRGFKLNKNITSIQYNKKIKSITSIRNYNNTKEKFVRLLETHDIQIIIPLIYKNELLGIVGLTRYNKKPLTSEEQTYLKSLTNIAATAIQQKIFMDELINSNEELDRKIHQMNTLFDLGKEISSILEKDKLIKLFTLSLMGQIGVSKYAIYFREKGELKLASSRLSENINGNLLNRICKVTDTLLIKDCNDVKLRNQLLKIGMRAIVPMKTKNELHGILLVGERISNKDYSKSDLEFLFSLGNLVVIAFENIRLFHEALEKQKMEDELIIARDIQKRLLPKILPKYKNLDISATNLSSKIVSGDYYDVFSLDGSRLIVAIADVSGKGTPASLLMASLQAILHALSPLNLSTSELVNRINKQIYENTSNDKFITFFLGIIDTFTKKLNYVNAGHNLPIIIKRSGEVIRLEKGGIILGVTTENIIYEEGNYNLNSGDILVLFTDGITEATNREGIEFGEERLISIIQNNKHLSSEDIQEKIINQVKQYSGDNQTDDVTLVVIKVN